MIPEINQQVPVQCAMFVCALVVCAAIGVAVNAMWRVPEVTARPVLQPRPPTHPGKLQDRHPSMMKADTLTAADRAIVAPPAPPAPPPNTPPIGQGSFRVSQRPVVAPIPYADPYADLDDPPATFAERWDAVNGDARPVVVPMAVLPVSPVAATKSEKPPALTTAPARMVAEAEQELVKPREVRPSRVPRVERTRDVCERHGLRKVERNGGRSWRCR